MKSPSTQTIQKKKIENNEVSTLSNKNIINLIPLKSIQDLFTNYNVVKIDENGLCDNLNIKKAKFNKVIFNITTQRDTSLNTPSNTNILSSNNNDDKNEIEKNKNNGENENNNFDTVYISNKIEPKINKSLSLFCIQYNKTSNNYILTSFTDEIFFALEIWSNKNFYLENSKRYYVQLSDIIISIVPNNIDKNITIKLLNLQSEEKGKNKYILDCNTLPITIGRNGCSININKTSISKVHLLINFDTNRNQFFIRDNFSTNGSLILLKKGKDIKLEDKMFFFLGKEHFMLKNNEYIKN